MALFLCCSCFRGFDTCLCWWVLGLGIVLALGWFELVYRVARVTCIVVYCIGLEVVLVLGWFGVVLRHGCYML